MTDLPAQSTVATGEGMEYSLEPMWTFAPAVVAVFAMACLAVLIAVYLHERGSAGSGLRFALAAIRLLLIAMTAGMLLGWVLHRDRTDLPDIILMVDDSQSMRFEDRMTNNRASRRISQRVQSAGFYQLSRLNLAKTLMLDRDGAWIRQLSERYNLKIYRMGSTIRAAPRLEQGKHLDWIRQLEANESVSALGKCLRDVLELQRGRPTAAVIALTDGITTEGKSIAEVAQYARRKSVPLLLIGLGSDRPPRDVRLSDLFVDDVVFVDDIVNFETRLTATGYEGTNIEVKLRELDNPNVLARQAVTLENEESPQVVRLAFRPKTAGEFTYVIEFDPLPGESDPQNNQVQATLKVRDESIRVLLVQGYPSFEYRYLSTVLGRQIIRPAAPTQLSSQAGRSIELTTVLQEADDEYAAADESVRRVFPVSRDELFQFDVIIFGDVNPNSLGNLEMNHLADFVKIRGGGILFIAGERYMPMAYRNTPLAELMPIDIDSATLPDRQFPLTEKFQVQPTRLGRSTGHMQLSEEPGQNRRVWNELDGLYWLLEVNELKPAARVLAEHPSRTGPDGQNLPVITMQFVGAGKSIFHATDETYRWQHRFGDEYFARYWIQTIRYLSRSKLIGESRIAEVVSDFDVYERGDPVHLRVRFFDERQAPAHDEGVTIVVQREGYRRQTLRLSRQSTSRGVFVGSATDLAAGQYRIWLATPLLEGTPPTARFTVLEPPGEQAQLQMNSADLREAAKKSAGRYYTFRNANRLMENLPRGRQVPVASLPPISLWESWPVPMAFGILFVALITLEWILRKRAGML